MKKTSQGYFRRNLHEEDQSRLLHLRKKTCGDYFNLIGIYMKKTKKIT